MSNSLIHETSPYLLQHAHNPVNWFPWGEKALQKAREENKPMLISIGYSACHWCHVMEKESFEDEQVAELMNAYFICIKVDREERPDIDQVYMQAVQLMTGQGGWPLNCFALPDGQPIYGGTYFPKQHWLKVLTSIHALYTNEKEKVLEYAERLTNGIRQSELIQNKPPSVFLKSDLDKLVQIWTSHFDTIEGGPDRAPKFPLPNNYQFLLRYGYLTQHKDILEHVELTLKKMAYGGIYDQIGGGFARYSTDEHWKVPHFEKMLYDNAQLVSLYAEAYQVTKKALYKQIVYETLNFIQRELTSDETLFYSALDADSEGVEGKFYVWTKEELQKAFGKNYPLLADYYNINEEGYWEHDNYILLRKLSEEEIASKHSLALQDVINIVEESKKTLLQIRSKRVRPGLDDKILTSWNALMIKGYIDAYEAFAEPNFLDIAIKASENILTKLKREDGGLWHSYKNKHTINGFLEDYAFTIEAFIALYQATFDEKWLMEAKLLITYVFEHFYDENSSLFFFTSDKDALLITRKREIQDNVIPASNSSVAKSLYILSFYFAQEKYALTATQMLMHIKDSMKSYGSAFSNWAQLLLHIVFPYYQIAIVGAKALERKRELANYYLPQKITLGTVHKSAIPLLMDKPANENTLLYVCENKTCGLPVATIEQVLIQINKLKKS